MADQDGTGESNGHPVLLRAEDAGTQAGLNGATPPAYADTTADDAGKRLPIIPESLRRKNIRGTVSQAAGLHWHRARYHGARSPGYLAKTLWYALRGGHQMTGRILAWWQAVELRVLESQAVAAGRPGHSQAMDAHRQGLKTRGQRGRILAVCLALAAVTVLALARYAPWWVWPPLAMLAVVLLARHGRPRGRPIVRPAVVAPAVEKLTEDIVVRALGSIGIAAINQAIAADPVHGIGFPDPIHRDGPGWLANTLLPHGVTATEVMDRREKLASGLRRELGCVWPETTPGKHPGWLSLWVGYRDMNKTPQPAWSLARQGSADLFKPVPFGTDQRGRVVSLTLMFVSVIIGSVPRMGKTFLLRLLGLIAALDPRAELHLYDLKGTGDLSPLECVAHRYRAGDEPEDIGYALADMRALREELRRRTKAIRELPREVCPESKVTPELASRRSLRLHPIVIEVDECQVWFEHPKHGGELEAICTDLVKRGPAVGIILILATQRPDAKSIPTPISANAVLRLCLKVMGWQENDMVLGTGAHGRGVRATMFSFDDKGIAYFAGEGDAPRIVRSFYVDAPAAEKVALRARGLRQAAGTLSGHALGETDEAEPPRDLLADVLGVFDGSEPNLYTETVAARLAERLAGAYHGITKEAVASQLRTLGVGCPQVRESGGTVRTGVRRADVEAARGAANVPA